MAAKKVTQKGRKKRVAKSHAKRGAQVKAAAKAARSNRQNARASAQAKTSGGGRQAGPFRRCRAQAAVYAGCFSISTSGKTCRTSSSLPCGLCCSCLSRWMMEAAQERGVALDMERAREKVYGMPYSEWKERHQPPATEEQLARFADAEKRVAERATKNPTK